MQNINDLLLSSRPRALYSAPLTIKLAFTTVSQTQLSGYRWPMTEHVNGLEWMYEARIVLKYHSTPGLHLKSIF